MAQVPYASYLRVYEPLAAFSEPERSHWAAYARRGRFPDAQEEIRRALAGLAATPPLAAPERESADAFVLSVHGVLCVCPWRTRLRAWQALGEAGHWMMPESVLDTALPRTVREGALAEYETWREANPDARPWIRSALWHVPVRWFVLFADAERQFRKPGEPPPAEGPAEEKPGAEKPAGPERPLLRYRTPMVQARRRLARGLRTVRRELPQGPLAEALVEVGKWLEEFHPRSLVELDYGGLVHTIPPEDLAADRSAEETAAALAALAEGDMDRANQIYEGLTDRWLSVRERQFAS
ncbi:hypothetical protein [Streptomyces aidingensis]|uniref:DUF8083 domain-containing protein n=1 Tax=Streptomyces aidingensis TaxID=910347 RepID=A0A1I1PYR1_9ACTN|nr:hypothetical protein [Streptomyces aidingensis]SFD14895.1 hypothetical protein SAMN05421773_110154 [Streptomyces aidingensis]